MYDKYQRLALDKQAVNICRLCEVLAGQAIAYTVGGLTQDICVSLLPVVCSPVVDLQTNKIVAVYAVSLA